MRKKIIRLFCFIIIAVLISGITVCAADDSSKLEGDYVFNGSQAVPISQAYSYEYSVNNIKSAPENAKTYFSEPADMFMASDGTLYIADMGNNRVVNIDINGNFISEYKEADGTVFSKPQGVFVTDDGYVFISDTGNSRIVKLDRDGGYITSYTKPVSSLLSDVDVYSPTKIAVSSAGAIYVLMGERIMSLDSSNNFRGYLDQTDVGFDFLEWLIRLVASKEQLQMIERRSAATYDNFCLGQNGLVVAVSRDTKEGQIKILNTVGNNIFRKISAIENDNEVLANLISKFFSGNVINKPFSYGERVDSKPAIFTDVCISDTGIVTALQSQNGKLYQYDQSGNLLAVFAGMGDKQGEFLIPSALATDSKGRLYVLDRSYGNISVMAPTEFILTVQKASAAYLEGDYKEADELWQEALYMDETYPLAHIGIGNTAYKNGDWKSAMEHYKYANERKLYSKAFKEYRYDFIHSHFLLTVVLIAVCVTALLLLIAVANKYSKKALVRLEHAEYDKASFGQELLLGISTVFRPARTMEAIKFGKKRVGVRGAVLFITVVFAVRLLFIYNTGYLFQDVEYNDINIFLEFIKLIVLVFTWILATYLISSQFSGESTLKQNFISVCYCMIPYSAVNLLALGMSQVLTWDEKGLFAVLVNGVTVWTVILMIKGIGRLNDYDLKHTWFVAFVSLVAMILIWFICIFGYSLFVRLVQLIEEIIREARML